jgi:Mn-containing catalase
MSDNDNFKGPWNEGVTPTLNEEWEYIKDPIKHVYETDGLLDEVSSGTERTEKSVQSANKKLSAERKMQVEKATLPKNGIMSWSEPPKKSTKGGNGNPLQS